MGIKGCLDTDLAFTWLLGGLCLGAALRWAAVGWGHLGFGGRMFMVPVIYENAFVIETRFYLERPFRFLFDVILLVVFTM